MVGILWGAWALVQTHISTIDFNYLTYGIKRLHYLLENKEKILASE